MAKKIGRKKQESLVMVGPGSDEGDEDRDENLTEENDEDEETGEDESESESSRKKAKKDEEEDGSDSDEDDERVGHGEDDGEEDEDGKPPKRERESRKARRERQRKARQRNETELNFLRSQNENLEREIREVKGRVERSEVGSVDQRISSIQSQMKVADQVLAKAHENGSGEDVVEATNIRDRLKETLGRLNGAKVELARRAEESEQEPAVDSRLVYHASHWMRKHSWYDPQGSDQDSRVVAKIDDRLVKEGYDPRSPEYWEELSDRVKSRLPHKFKSSQKIDDDDDNDEEDESRKPEKRGSGPRFSTGGRERPLRKNEVYVSPERKQALIDAGVWDDPVLRGRYLKKYKDWDSENGPRGRSAR